ncbi:hypothetical protein [Planktothrix rubescens]|nr:hypothetical protein [Planktothrix rubescens]
MRSKKLNISGASPKSMWSCLEVCSGFWGDVGDRVFSGQKLRLLIAT